MKTRFLFMFSFFLTAGSLQGQVDKVNYDKLDNYDKFDYIDSDIRNITGPSSPSNIRSVLDISKSLNIKSKHNSKDFIFQDIGPLPSLIPVKPNSHLKPVNKEQKFKRNLYYPYSIYLPDYPTRDTIRK